VAVPKLLGSFARIRWHSWAAYISTDSVEACCSESVLVYAQSYGLAQPQVHTSHISEVRLRSIEYDRRS